ncbi:MAG: SUMF1/EgtB/PvdO family nonheme iron enzyme, partial [Planctomycetota bacterium]
PRLQTGGTDGYATVVHYDGLLRDRSGVQLHEFGDADRARVWQTDPARSMADLTPITVTVDSFWVLDREVSMQLWDAIMDGAPPGWSGKTDLQALSPAYAAYSWGGERPVVGVDDASVTVFLDRVQAQWTTHADGGSGPATVTPSVVELPTEAQWEWCARPDDAAEPFSGEERPYAGTLQTGQIQDNPSFDADGDGKKRERVRVGVAYPAGSVYFNQLISLDNLPPGTYSENDVTHTYPDSNASPSQLSIRCVYDWRFGYPEFFPGMDPPQGPLAPDPTATPPLTEYAILTDWMYWNEFRSFGKAKKFGGVRWVVPQLVQWRNPRGLLHLHGNVAEMVRDHWDGRQGHRVFPNGWNEDASLPYRVVKGGSWRDPAQALRAAARAKVMSTAYYAAVQSAHLPMPPGFTVHPRCMSDTIGFRFIIQD